jgi:hypothetical protein
LGIGWGIKKAWKWGKKLWNWLRPCNSFAADTLVHVRPVDASDSEAKSGRSVLKRIDQIAVGDEVLAQADWIDGSRSVSKDSGLSYQPVVDTFFSYRNQTVVWLLLDSGTSIVTTQGHPFKTPEGWRDAIFLKRGGQLLLKGDHDRAGDQTVTIAEVQHEERMLPMFNLEVANAHTYFVGEDGELVHNAACDRVARLRKEFESKVKPAYWKEKARSNPAGYSPDDLAKMRRGKPPMGSDGHPMELHHNQSLENMGSNDFSNLREMTRTDHRLGDNYRLNHPKP